MQERRPAKVVLGGRSLRAATRGVLGRNGRMQSRDANACGSKRVVEFRDFKQSFVLTMRLGAWEQRNGANLTPVEWRPTGANESRRQALLVSDVPCRTHDSWISLGRFRP